jgi:hypothetical protein
MVESLIKKVAPEKSIEVVPLTDIKMMESTFC